MKDKAYFEDCLISFRQHLKLEEKSPATIGKYLRDVSSFLLFCDCRNITKEIVMDYKETLIETGYATRSINSMLASLNSYFVFVGRTELRVKPIKVQNRVFCPEETELSRQEYKGLCKAALTHKNERIFLIMQTICGTGIRVSELRYITVEAVMRGEATVSCKGKNRSIFIVKKLQKLLKQYAHRRGILSGAIFVTSSGKPVDRSNIWREMKSLCSDAGIAAQKVFPHNLRHLFARVFYALEKDLVKLADILGHSNINTTRIYTISTGAEHRKKMEQMRLIL